MKFPPKQNRVLSKVGIGNAGFSLVEILVAAVVLMLGATIALALFTSATQLFKKGQSTDNDQIAINEDLAEIKRRNRRFVCTEGDSCLLWTLIEDPDEDDFAPKHPCDGLTPAACSSTVTLEAINSYKEKLILFTGKPLTDTSAVKGLCSYEPTPGSDVYPGISYGEPSDLVKIFKEIALDTLNNPVLAEQEIQRSAADITTPALESPTATPHAYVINYTKDGKTLRQIRMAPLVANWCP